MGDSDRSYVQYLPTAYDGATPRPLVLTLHGYLGKADVHFEISDIKQDAERGGFIAVAPQASGDLAYWNSTLEPSLKDDVLFVTRLLDTLGAELCVDLARVYAMGGSNGGLMASRLGCELPDRFAAVGAVAATSFPACSRTDPVPIISFHGDADPFIPFQGGISPVLRNLQVDEQSRKWRDSLDLRPIDAILREWALRNRCVQQPRVERVAPDVRREVYDGCAADADVVLYVIEGGGHTMPGTSAGLGLEGVLGRTTMSIRAGELMWEFFERHTRR